MDAEAFAKWVADVRWQVATTMPEIPHEYHVFAWGDRDAFYAAVRFIQQNGYRAVWRKDKPKPYFDLDGRLYWGGRVVINRAVVGEPNAGVVERVIPR